MNQSETERFKYDHYEPLLRTKGEAVTVLAGVVTGLLAGFVAINLVLMELNTAAIVFGVLTVIGQLNLMVLGYRIVLRRGRTTAWSLFNNPFDRERIAALSYVMGRGGWLDACRMLALDWKRWRLVRIGSIAVFGFSFGLAVILQMVRSDVNF